MNEVVLDLTRTAKIFSFMARQTCNVNEFQISNCSLNENKHEKKFGFFTTPWTDPMAVWERNQVQKEKELEKKKRDKPMRFEVNTISVL